MIWLSNLFKDSQKPSIIKAPSSSAVVQPFTAPAPTTASTSNPQAQTEQGLLMNMKSASCNLCNVGIPNGDGYAFYNSFQQMDVKVGNMLLCHRCTDGILLWLKDGRIVESNPLWGLCVPEYGEGDAKMWKQVKCEQIVTRCRLHGFSPEAAKAKARELAEKCWSDPERGPLIVAVFWDASSPPPPKAISQYDAQR